MTGDADPAENARNAPAPAVIHEGLPTQLPDIDPDETQDWISSFDALLDERGRERARYIMLRLLERARQKQVGVPALRSTDYINSIPPEREPWFPGDEEIERRIRAFIRWNAAVMVSSANRKGLEVGGHIATYQSSASLYEVGFNHFFRGKDHPGGGDQIYIQGHGSPGIYARAFLEGRLNEQQLSRFRQEVQHGVGAGLPSYPHPRLMPDFWEFPTVSMGLTAINSIYQARFNRYLQNRGIKDTSEQNVWAFLGDGEMAEPESLGAIRIAAREELDNLVWVINCNLQQLDGPVTGNGKIIQELEANFRGAGWNVIKVIWGREWDELLARDVDGVLVNQMNSTPDGQFQTFSVEDGAYNREHFFGPDPRLRKMVEHMTDRQIEKLPRGGHDYRKVYAAFDAATKHTGQPTVILAHTIKGWTIDALEGRNATHQMKKLTMADLKKFRDRLYLPISDRDLQTTYEDTGTAPFFHPGNESPEIEYMLERRRSLGGSLPRRVVRSTPLQLPGDKMYAELKQGSGKNKIATTMAVVRLLKDWMKDPEIGKRFVPIAPDEYRTFGMDSMFPSRQGLRPGRTDLRVGRPQAAARLQDVAAGPDAARGHLRGRRRGVGDRRRVGVLDPRRAHDPVLHLLLDVRLPADRGLDLGDGRPARPRLPDRCHRRPHHIDRRGSPARRRALAADRGDQPRSRALRPRVRLRDLAHHAQRARADVWQRRSRPAGRERHLLHHGLQRAGEPAGRARGRGRRRHPARDAPDRRRRRRRPAGAAARVRCRGAVDRGRCPDAARGLGRGRRHLVGHLVERARARRRGSRGVEPAPPVGDRRTPFVTEKLTGSDGPVVAVSDYMRAVPLQIARWVPEDYRVLGAEGFGFADTRPAARRFFHIDAQSVVVQALQALADAGEIDPNVVEKAFTQYRIDDPTAVSGVLQEGGDA